MAYFHHVVNVTDLINAAEAFLWSSFLFWLSNAQWYRLKDVESQMHTNVVNIVINSKCISIDLAKGRCT